MNYTMQSLSGVEMMGKVVASQEESFPFVEYILPSDFDAAKKAMQAILEARWPGGFLSMSSWRYIGMGGDRISMFLKHYLLYSRELRNFITPVTFSEFKSGMKSKWPDLEDDCLTEWLNAMLEAQVQGTLPDTILKPYNYVPESVTAIDIALKGVKPLIDPQLNLLIWVGGAVAVIYLLGKSAMTGGVKLPSFRKS